MVISENERGKNGLRFIKLLGDLTTVAGQDKKKTLRFFHAHISTPLLRLAVDLAL
jgi:hypothetical protein